jgi:hypothetical protein
MKMHLIADSMGTFEFLRPHLSSRPPLVRFVVGMSTIFVMPGFSRPLSCHRRLGSWLPELSSAPGAGYLRQRTVGGGFHSGSGFRSYEAMEIALYLPHSDGFRNRNLPTDSARGGRSRSKG